MVLARQEGKSRISFGIQRGDGFLQPFSLYPFGAEWTAPDKDWTGKLIVVVRDRRGGIDWLLDQRGGRAMILFMNLLWAEPIPNDDSEKYDDNFRTNHRGRNDRGSPCSG